MKGEYELLSDNPENAKFYFEKILDIKATQYVPKPDPKSYEIMLKSFGIFSNQTEHSIFIAVSYTHLTLPTSDLV